MSNRYKGGIISATPPTTSTSSASGAWTLEQQMQAQAAGTWPSTPNYIEEVFSTYLYTGNGSTQTITNGIDLSTKGGLVWIKGTAGTGHRLTDTVRGVTNSLTSNSTAAQVTESTGLTAFNTTGFNIGADADYNTSSSTYASWTFEKQPKFFDVVTYTGNGFGSRDVSHNLGSVPGFVIIKRTDSTSAWGVWHRGNGVSAVTYFSLNTTAAGSIDTSYTSFTTATTFVVDGIGPTSGSLNIDGASYVAYLFAHNAGGFGLTATDNVISCGTYTGTGSAGNAQTLGYEPQWMMVKNISAVGNWFIVDTIRGFSTISDSPLYANSTNSEDFGAFIDPNSTGFQFPTGSNLNTSAATYIYIAIRRGPMKVPTDPTKVFWTGLGNGSATVPAFVTGFVVDGGINRLSYTGVTSNITTARLTGNEYMVTNNTDVAVADFDFVYRSNTGYIEGPYGGAAGNTQATAWAFQRAPSFMDIVCYTGTGVARTVTHNLGATPELMLVKRRSTVAESWAVYSVTAGNTKFLRLNDTLAATTSADRWNNTTPTSSVFTVGIDSEVNASGETYINYLFATCPGVSKVGSYSGTGATQTINCGFTGGAKFVLIKRTDTTGDWYYWDTVRGMVAGTDPSLRLNTTAAQVNANSVYTVTTGFQIVSTVAGINASGGTYIFLAIA